MKLVRRLSFDRSGITLLCLVVEKLRVHADISKTCFRVRQVLELDEAVRLVDHDEYLLNLTILLENAHQIIVDSVRREIPDEQYLVGRVNLMVLWSRLLTL